ncbi:MAG TPA: hypothetical protein VHA52_06900 [Candidatus Babeliaceae bacterium]|nr:hypothetical protein [Candidatus Babeliaceae bacterium]
MKPITIEPRVDLSVRPVAPDLLERIEAINLTVVRDRHIHKYGWEEKRTDEAIANYQLFLFFTQLFGDPVSPTKDVDEIWHSHLLHTNKYFLDCDKMFGKYLHHMPNPISNIQNGNCSSPCCNKSDCCNDNPTKAVNWILNQADCDGPIEGGCVNIGGSDTYCGGTTNDGFVARVDYDNPDPKTLVKSIPFETAYIHFLAMVMPAL